MRSGGYCTWSVCLCVCVCVYDYSRSVGNETAYERYQRVQCHAGLIFKMAIFVQVLRSKVMAWKPSEQANMLMSMAYLDQILPVSSTVERVEVTRRASM